MPVVDPLFGVGRELMELCTMYSLNLVLILLSTSVLHYSERGVDRRLGPATIELLTTRASCLASGEGDDGVLFVKSKRGGLRSISIELSLLARKMPMGEGCISIIRVVPWYFPVLLMVIIVSGAV